jgi:hypothetical protein
LNGGIIFSNVDVTASLGSLTYDPGASLTLSLFTPTSNPSSASLTDSSLGSSALTGTITVLSANSFSITGNTGGTTTLTLPSGSNVTLANQPVNLVPGTVFLNSTLAYSATTQTIQISGPDSQLNFDTTGTATGDEIPVTNN